LWITGETVEKVSKQILGGDAEKNDFTECATINDLMPGKGQVSPRKPPLNRSEGVFRQSRKYSSTRSPPSSFKKVTGEEGRIRKERLDSFIIKNPFVKRIENASHFPYLHERF